MSGSNSCRRGRDMMMESTQMYNRRALDILCESLVGCRHGCAFMDFHKLPFYSGICVGMGHASQHPELPVWPRTWIPQPGIACCGFGVVYPRAKRTSGTSAMQLTNPVDLRCRKSSFRALCFTFKHLQSCRRRRKE
jgi:hypothetical protein